MRRTIYTIIVLVLLFALGGCFEEGTKSDRNQAKATEQLMEEADRQVGMPAITRFTQKKTMRMIQEECDREDLVCYAYFANEMEGKLGDYIGRCIGYGVPFSAQFTNPEKIADSFSGGYAILPQPDPNGLFMPTSSDATWVMLVDPKTKKGRPVYFEPKIIVSPFKLH